MLFTDGARPVLALAVTVASPYGFGVQGPPHRQDTKNAVWLEASHDGWTRHFGLRHERRLYLDAGSDELRGEDSLVPVSAKARPDGY